MELGLLRESVRLRFVVLQGRGAPCSSTAFRWSLVNGLDMVFGQDAHQTDLADGCGPERFPGSYVKTSWLIEVIGIEAVRDSSPILDGAFSAVSCSAFP